MVYIEFNQQLRVPGFLDRTDMQFNKTISKNNSTPIGRQMIPLSELDVQRDFFDFIFILKSEVDPAEIKYFLEITYWDEYQVNVFMNFSNPLLISKGIFKD